MSASRSKTDITGENVMKLNFMSCAIALLAAGAGISAHAAGILFVGNENNGTVSEYNGSTGQFIKNISTASENLTPSGLALGPSGNLWVNNVSGTSASLSISHGNETATARPADPGSILLGAAVSNNTLYVTDANAGKIDSFNATTGLQTGSFAVRNASSSSLAGVAVNPANGNLYVVDDTPNAIEEYSPSGSYLGNFVSNLRIGGGFLVFHNNDLYVDTTGQIEVFNASNGQMVNVIGSGLNPGQIDFDPNGNLFVTNISRVDEFSSSGTLITSNFAVGGQFAGATGLAFYSPTSPAPELPVPLMLSLGLLGPVMLRRIRGPRPQTASSRA